MRKTFRRGRTIATKHLEVKIDIRHKSTLCHQCTISLLLCYSSGLSTRLCFKGHLSWMYSHKCTIRNRRFSEVAQKSSLLFLSNNTCTNSPPNSHSRNFFHPFLPQESSEYVCVVQGISPNLHTDGAETINMFTQTKSKKWPFLLS